MNREHATLHLWLRGAYSANDRRAPRTLNIPESPRAFPPIRRPAEKACRRTRAATAFQACAYTLLCSTRACHLLACLSLGRLVPARVNAPRGVFPVRNEKFSVAWALQLGGNARMLFVLIVSSRRSTIRVSLRPCLAFVDRPARRYATNSFAPKEV